MGGILGGGGGGTQTVVQNNTPFNANELRTVQQGAIDLRNSNPLSYYPGTTYATPNNQQLGILNNTSNLYGNAGNMAAGNLGNQQSEALSANQGFVNGQALNGAYPNINNLFALGSNNPASGAVSNINNTFAPGSWFPNGSQNYQQFLVNETNSGAAQNLNTIGSGAYMNAQAPWTSALANWGSNGAGAGSLNNVANGLYFNGSMPILSALQNAPNGTPEAGALNNFTSGAYLNGVSPYTSGLANTAYGGPAAGQLGATAAGSYLGSNPYLDATFQAASRPVVSAFQTAVSPGIDSRMEAAGRFNSGANANAQTNAQETLAKSLGDLSAGIYGPAYEAERNRQIQSAQALGGLQTSALGTAGQLYGQQTGQLGTAAGTLGQLRGTDLANALQGYNTGVNTLSNAATSYGDLAQRGYTNALTAQNQSLGIQENAADALMKNQTTAFLGAGGLFNQMGETLRNAYNNAGTLSTQGQNSQVSALGTGLDNYYRGIAAQQAAIGQTPGLSTMGAQDYQTALAASNNIQSLQQQEIADAMNRFYGNQYSPWATLGQAAGLVGSGIPGSSALTSPMGSGGFGNVLQGLGAANSLFGSGGLGSLFGAGSGAGGTLAGLTGAVQSGLGGGFAFAPTLANANSLFGGAGALSAADASAYAFANPAVFTGSAIADSAAKAAPAFLSDRRLKTDIKKIGELNSGLPAYLFRYTWSDEPQIGVMADEVEKVQPDAVMDTIYGFKAVNYGKLK